MYVASRGKAVAWRRPPKPEFTDVALGSVRPGRRDGLFARGHGHAQLLTRLNAEPGNYLVVTEADVDAADLRGAVRIAGTAGGILEDQTAFDTAALIGTTPIQGALGPVNEGFFDSANLRYNLPPVSARHEYLTARGAVTGWRTATAPTTFAAIVGSLAALDGDIDTAQIISLDLSYMAATETTTDLADLRGLVGVAGLIDATDVDADTASIVAEGVYAELFGDLVAVDIDFDLANIEGRIQVVGHIDAIEDAEDTARIRSLRAGASNWTPVPKDTGIWVRMN